MLKQFTLYRRDFKPMQDGNANPNYSAFDDLLWDLFAIEEQSAQEIEEVTIRVDVLKFTTDNCEFDSCK